MRTCPDEFVAFAGELADIARPIVKRYFRTRLDVETKGDESPVTIADREAERAMREAITGRFPDHGIVGEEWGETNPDADWCWILDPVDGTKSFITGSLGFGTLIALAHGGEPVLGVIDQPITEERWLGYAGGPATLDGREIAVRPCPDIAEAALYTAGFSYLDDVKKPAFERLSGACALTRFSHDCYAAGLLAAGFVDIWVEMNLNSWDIAAAVPVIERAGGTVTDWHGQPLAYDNHDNRLETVLAVGDKALLRPAVDILAYTGP